MNELSELQKAAKVAFASEFSFYLKTHNFHWNVTGSDFYEYHKLFEEIYLEVYGSIDDFAEKIRSLGTFVPASLQRFSMLSTIDDELEIIPAASMVQELLADSMKIVALLKIVYDLAEQDGKHGFSNFLAERMDAHEKHNWMLRSTLR
jgi:starvation-inducible DNA-binding protein